MSLFHTFSKKICLIIVGVTMVISVALQAQPKQQLLRTDYKLWHKLRNTQISNYGRWVSYRYEYESHEDTLFIKNVKTVKVWPFAMSTNGVFAGEKVFACQNIAQELLLTDLKSNKQIQIPNVLRYQFLRNDSFLLTIEGGATARTLCIRNIWGKILLKIQGVTAYTVNHNKDQILFGNKNEKGHSAGIVRLDRTATLQILDNVHDEIKDLAWSDNDSKVVFYLFGTDVKVGMYDLAKKRLHVLTRSDSPVLSANVISETEDSPLKVSNDGARVFFGIRAANFTPAEDPLVQIWNGTDKYLYPIKAGNLANNAAYIAVWHTEDNRVVQLTDANHAVCVLSEDYSYALTADRNQYAPNYKYHLDLDFYITDLANGKRIPLTGKMYAHPQNIGTSLNGKYVYYYRDGNWWIYDTDANHHTNITASLTNEWDNHDYDPGDANVTYGVAGWSADSKFIFIYDRYDLWQISADGSEKYRLTNGRSLQLQFRLIDIPTKNGSYFNYYGNRAGIIDRSHNLIFSAENLSSRETGYFIMDANLPLEVLEFGKEKLHGLKFAAKTSAYIFTREDHNLAPQIVLKNKIGKEREIVQTNPQQQKFLWSTSEIVTYRNSKGENLTSTLFFPAGFDASRTYPMIVYIYERLSSWKNTYCNPSDHAGGGFNVTAMTTNGYFVLMPDIKYGVGSTGLDAADCTIGAVKNVLDRKYIDASKIGLYGHSFGGFESNFIITQTDIFAAAISGCAPSDLQRTYFTMQKDSWWQESWRLENQQFRMGKSFFNAMDNYDKNSPIRHAEKISTPLLIWSGAEDENVQTNQSIAFYIALKRLDKKFIMLLYPNEGHILFKSSTTEDLHTRILDWYGHFLKGYQCDWITKGTIEQ